LFFRAGIVIAV